MLDRAQAKADTACAAAEAARIDAEYGSDKIKQLIDNDGWD